MKSPEQHKAQQSIFNLTIYCAIKSEVGNKTVLNLS